MSTAVPDVAIDDTPRRAFFTPASLAEFLSVSERHVRDLLARGEIASYKLGENTRRIDPSDVDLWLKSKREGGHDG